jgi:FkbM family methyltransferase
MSNHILVQTPYGPAYWVPEGDYVAQTVSRGAKNTGYNNFLKLMKPNARTAIDVGANIGEITYALSRFSHQVHAFDPVTDTYDLLQKNVAHNNIRNAMTYCLGLGDKPETAIISLSTNTCGANARVVGNTTRATEQMQIVTLDSFCFADVDILKIDVEGFELDVLKGAEQTITRDMPIIQLEAYEPALRKAKRDIQDIYDWLIARGFEPYYVKNRKVTKDQFTYSKVPRCIERFFIHNTIQVPDKVPTDCKAI